MASMEIVVVVGVMMMKMLCTSQSRLMLLMHIKHSEWIGKHGIHHGIHLAHRTHMMSEILIG